MTIMRYRMDMTTSTKLRPVPADEKNGYEALKTDHKGAALPMHEVTVDGVRLGRVYQVESSSQIHHNGSRISSGTSYRKYWMADTRDNNAMVPTAFSSRPHAAQVRGPYGETFATRAVAVSTLVEVAGS